MDEHQPKPTGAVVRAKTRLQHPMNILTEVIEMSSPDNRCMSTASEVFRVGASLIHRRSRRVESPQGEGRLRPKEFDLLLHLYEHVTQTFSREKLLQLVWNYPPGIVTRTVDQTIATLRKKIELDSVRPRFLQTVHGFGYRLVL
jgi:two-component system, OmpR family, alkaline phosphatase synthesis response regulator PhoP